MKVAVEYHGSDKVSWIGKVKLFLSTVLWGCQYLLLRFGIKCEGVSEKCFRTGFNDVTIGCSNA